MTPDKQLQETLDGIGRTFEEFKKANDAALKGKADGKAVGEIEAKLAKIDGALTELVDTKAKLEAAIDRYDARVKALEVIAEGYASGQKGGPAAKAQTEHGETFVQWMRAPREHRHELAAKLLKAERAALGEKAIAGTTGALGGFAIPEIIARGINEQVGLLSPVRGLVKVVGAGSPDYKELVAMHTETSGWINETGTRSETDTPALRERAPTFGTLYCYPRATEESLQDLFFDVGAFLVDYCGWQMALQEGIAVISGNGSNKPTGLLASNPVSTDDGASPIRAAGVLEYVPIAVGSSPATKINPDDLITLVHTLRSPYRVGARWAMNSLTMGAVRRLKDTTGQYLWQPGLAAGTPDSLLGYPVAVWENLPDIAANAHPLLFGNFTRGYVLVDLAGIRITPDEITTPGYTKWYIRRRMGGCILDNNAIKAGKVSAT